MTAVRIGRDAALIYLAAFLRSSAVGVTGVILAIYLSELGLSAAAIGFVIASGAAGGAVATLVIGIWGDAIGRRRSLTVLTVLSAAGYIALGTATHPIALMLLAFVGMVNGMGRDRGAASALEQAILPETTGPADRTWMLAWYNLVLDAGHAIGALAGATPAVLARILRMDSLAAHRMTFELCAVAILIGIAPYLGLGRGVEIPRPAQSPVAARRLDPRSKRIVTRLALLFGLDSIGGGFLSSALIAYWFFRRYGTPESHLALLLFSARVLNAASHVAAAWMARRIGLMNTMVLTHLPSSVLLMIAPAAPTAAVAGTLFLAREALVEMDVPTRQSYVLAVVGPEERTFASSVTTVTRTTAWTIGPSVAGLVMQHVALAAPLVIGGTLKILYDLLLYRSFRGLKPPEERDVG
jgi:MFS family permease